MQRLQAAKRDLRLPGEIAKLDRFDLLLLDDFSYVRRDQTESTLLFELITERYERKSISTPVETTADVIAHLLAAPKRAPIKRTAKGPLPSSRRPK